MMIRKIRMENFRGFRDKTINSMDKTVVLLSAANGVGKTTTIDAIEWCLTGKIGRLKTAFDTRSTNGSERKMNTNGILKNRDAEEMDMVRVTLWLIDGENETVLCREQKNDELNPQVSKVTIDEDEEKAKAFIQEYIGDSFYNFHICDVQKSFNIQSKKRSELNDVFSDFITNYDDQIQISENLKIFAKDVNRYIEDKTKQKISLERIEKTKEQYEEACGAAKRIPYPKIKFYSDEKVEINGLSNEELTAQKMELQNCGYQEVEKKLSRLIENEILKHQQTIMEQLLHYWRTKGESIRQALKVGFLQNTETISNLEIKLKKLMDLNLSRETIFEDGEKIIALKIKWVTQADFHADKEEIKKKEKLIKILSEEINLLTENNRMLKLLSFLSANKQAMIEYRDTVSKENGTVRCPICGSETFSSMETALILKEADKYIKKNGETVRAKEIERTSLQTEIDVLFRKMINYIKTAVEKERETLETEISSLKVLNEEIQPYFDAVRKLQETGKNIKVQELTLEKSSELLAGIQQKLLQESEEQKLRDSYQQILNALGYDFKDEMIQQTYEKVKNLISRSFEVSDFSYEVLMSKINVLDGVLANKKAEILKQELDECNKKNRDLDIEIEKLQRLEDIADQRAKDIRNIVEKLSKEEYEKVGPAISKFYNKLARFNIGEGINIVQEDKGLSLVDDKGKNIVNVLSNGQISVFMLAHFFAGINSRNDREKMKIYFIDDLTSCMDDVNMLAFMDLLKYQISSKATMKQLFFITCDERISKLLKYKLDGRGIELRELLEADFKC